MCETSENIINDDADVEPTTPIGIKKTPIKTGRQDFQRSAYKQDHPYDHAVRAVENKFPRPDKRETPYNFARS